MIYDARTGRHDDIQTVLLYACPNINAKYTADDIRHYTWTGDYPVCAVCGKTKAIDGVHHEPPRSKGSLRIVTGMGTHVVKPTLMTLCKACHKDRHNGRLSFAWRFDRQSDEDMFLEGGFFKLGWQEHDERFWELGSLMMNHRGELREVRGWDA